MTAGLILQLRQGQQLRRDLRRSIHRGAAEMQLRLPSAIAGFSEATARPAGVVGGRHQALVDVGMPHEVLRMRAGDDTP